MAPTKRYRLPRLRCPIAQPNNILSKLLEVTTWNQLAIHAKPVIVLNVLGFFDALRTLIRSGISGGFIRPENESLLLFIDGPGTEADAGAHENFDWGAAALAAIDAWKPSDVVAYQYDWSLKKPDGGEEHRYGDLDAT